MKCSFCWRKAVKKLEIGGPGYLGMVDLYRGKPSKVVYYCMKKHRP